MYGFRKSFTAATFIGEPRLWGVDFKTVLVVAQTLGYTFSKFVGIRLVAEVRPENRIRSLLTQIVFAQIALLLFAITPAPWCAVWLFVNGLMLGTIFGLVVGYLEGRRHTEVMISALCTSFILADGAMKSVGAELLSRGVPERWMPFAAGLMFLLPLVLCCAILRRVPPPDDLDVAARSERAPMDAVQRRRLLARYGFGLGLIVAMYSAVSIVRSIRSDFAPEIWMGLGIEPDAALFTQSEVIVMLGILVLNGSMILVRDNRIAFFAALGLSGLGFATAALSLVGLRAEWLPPFPFMVLLGLGIYLPYIAVHTTLFERFIAMTRDRGTIGYLMYLADAFGYLGVVAVLLLRHTVGRSAAEPSASADMLPLLLTSCMIVSVGGIALLIPAFLYFRRLRSES
jgi:hypothetical protein